MTPNAEQRRFILEELVPFIKRDAGVWFAMEEWTSEIDEGFFEPNECRVIYDGVEHDFEGRGCGCVCCMGGAVQHLKKLRPPSLLEDRDRLCAEAMGISVPAARGLFYGWSRCGYGEWEGRLWGWPLGHVVRFEQAETAAAKAEVAADLLREVAERGSDVLDRGPYDPREDCR